MTEITDAECRELCEKLGIEWHYPIVEGPHHYIGARCSCGKVSWNSGHAKKNNPDFRDARVPLRLAMKREDWVEFRDYMTRGWHGMTTLLDKVFSLYITDTTGQLAKLLLEWLRGRE